jgi:hypothetical protein
MQVELLADDFQQTFDLDLAETPPLTVEPVRDCTASYCFSIFSSHVKPAYAFNLSAKYRLYPRFVHQQAPTVVCDYGVPVRVSVLGISRGDCHKPIWCLENLALPATLGSDLNPDSRLNETTGPTVTQ